MESLSAQMSRLVSELGLVQIGRAAKEGELQELAVALPDTQLGAAQARFR